MLTKRNYFVILMLFIVVFIMFMLVDISAGYLTRNAYNPQADIPVTITSDQVISSAVLDADAPASAREESSEDVVASVADNPMIAIIVSDKQGSTASVMREWCLYTKHRYQVFTHLPDSSEISDCRALFFGEDMIDRTSLPILMQYAETGVDMIFTQLPDYAILKRNPDLADFFGIGGFVQDHYQLDGVYIFDEFFLGGDRIYAKDDDFGDTDADVQLEIPYYVLRPGYLMFAQAISPDKSVDYRDLPGLLWRTNTGASNVYVVNTDIFTGKRLLGLLTAFLSQSDAYDIYPVVNAQTISMVDFPMLSNENTEALQAIYSRDAEALGRDVIWPSAAKILRNYEGSYNFFMAPQLDYTDAADASAEFISFYRQEIERLSGALGISMNQISDMPLDEMAVRNNIFLTEALPTYRFTAAYVTDEQQEILRKEGMIAPLSDVTLLMTDEQADKPLMGFVNDKTLTVSFTTDGFIHESMDDLHLLSIETALGMNNQKVEMSRAFYPDSTGDWNELTLQWSRGDTYQKPFEAFDAVTVYELEQRVRNFLALDYSASLNNQVITLNVSGQADQSSFVLRLFSHEIVSVSGASYTQMSDTAYLLRPNGATVEITISDMHDIQHTPDTYLEVIKP